MFDQEMGGADLALSCGTRAVDAGSGGGSGGAVVSGHVEFQFVRVGILGRFPARFMRLLVEVVGQVLGVGVPDFPVGREASVSLGWEWLVERTCYPASEGRTKAYHDCRRIAMSVGCLGLMKSLCGSWMSRASVPDQVS